MKPEQSLLRAITNVKPVSNRSVTWLSRHRPSVAFACCIGAGPWKIGRRRSVQQSFIDMLRDDDISSNRALRKLETASQLSWQFSWFKRANNICRKHHVLFDDVFDASRLDRRLALDNFEAVFGADANNVPKVVALFARDYLFIPCFPVDRHVRRWLDERGLPRRPRDVVQLFTNIGIGNPSGYSRAIFNSKAQNPLFTPTRRLT